MGPGLLPGSISVVMKVEILAAKTAGIAVLHFGI